MSCMGFTHQVESAHRYDKGLVRKNKTVLEFEDAAGGSDVATVDGAATVSKYYVFPTATHDHYNLNATTTTINMFWQGALTVKGRIEIVCTDGSGTLAGTSMGLYAEWTNSSGTSDVPTNIPIASKGAYNCAVTGILNYEFFFNYTIAIPTIPTTDVLQVLKLRFDLVQTAGVAANDKYKFGVNNHVILQHHPEAFH